MQPVGYYVSLLEDRPRIATVLRAIARTVKPGDVVVEVGCGIGTYALAALKAGAAHVTAIDSNPMALALARELGVAREGGDRLTLIEAAAESVELARRADVVIFEDYGTLGLTPGLRSLLDAVRTRMAKPDARYIPQAVDVVLAPTDQVLRPIGPSDASSLPFSAAALAMLRKRSLNDPFQPDLMKEALLATGEAVGRIVPGQDLPQRVRLAGSARATRSGAVTGLIGWIRLDFGNGDVVDNAPAVPPPTYAPTALPFEDALPVEEGERLELSLEAIGGASPKLQFLQWGITGARGSRDGGSANGLPGDLALLQRGSVGEVPVMSRLHDAAAEAFRQIDGKKSAAQIGSNVYTLYRNEFRNERAAADFVQGLLDHLRGRLPL